MTYPGTMSLKKNTPNTANIKYTMNNKNRTFKRDGSENIMVVISA